MAMSRHIQKLERATLRALFLFVAVMPYSQITTELQATGMPSSGRVSGPFFGGGKDPFNWGEYGGEFLDLCRDAYLELSRIGEKRVHFMVAFDKSVFSAIISHQKNKSGRGVNKNMANAPIIHEPPKKLFVCKEQPKIPVVRQEMLVA